MSKSTIIQTICQNRKARYEYHIIDTIEAGIVLTGTEIKSVRQRHVSLDGSYIIVQNRQVILVNTNIEQYSHGSCNNHDPRRNRILLLHKQQIKKFAEHAKIKGFTIIPLHLYLHEGIAKLEIAIAKGKQIHDKRQSIKDRDNSRSQEG